MLPGAPEIEEGVLPLSYIIYKKISISKNIKKNIKNPEDRVTSPNNNECVPCKSL